MFTDGLHMEVTATQKGRLEAVMHITPDLYQAHGYVHGGATLSFLESMASLAVEDFVDFERELPFGVEVHVRHRKSGRKGDMHGVAELDHVDGNKYYWNVSARDDEGDVISDGVIMTKVVSLARVAEKLGVDHVERSVPALGGAVAVRES